MSISSERTAKQTSQSARIYTTKKKHKNHIYNFNKQCKHSSFALVSNVHNKNFQITQNTMYCLRLHVNVSKTSNSNACNIC